MEKLDILLVEDDAYDAKLVESAVRRSTIEASWTRVDNELDFITALDAPHDVIVTDFKLPSFNALRVLEILEERRIDLPALVVTGALDDELAADCIKRGAADYLLKDRLARLGDAIVGAVARHRARRERRQAEERLLTEAKVRIVLYAMLSKSLSRSVPGAEVKADEVLAPLLEVNAIPGLVGVRYERPDGAGFEGGGADMVGEKAFELRRGLEGPNGSLGALVFSFAPQSPPTPDLEQFLAQAAAVFLGYLVRTDAERELVRSVAEKDELLREIHHRVKNNLAAIAGLISLEAGRSTDEAVRSVLIQLEGRINSMALVHEMLYARGSFTGVDFGEYARELAIRVAQSVGADTADFNPLVECSELYVPLETAVTLGIMVSELYARSAQRTIGEKQVSVSLRAQRAKEGAAVWRVEYTEHGEPGTMVPSSGLDLVGQIVAQFGGTLSETPGGLSVCLDLSAGQASTPP